MADRLVGTVQHVGRSLQGPSDWKTDLSVLFASLRHLANYVQRVAHQQGLMPQTNLCRQRHFDTLRGPHKALKQRHLLLPRANTAGLFVVTHWWLAECTSLRAG